jgi:hypothetical protein
MENAFDQVKHSFVFDVLHQFGISDDFIRWISSCISNPWISALVIGCPDVFFNESRGLKQRFPLSPLLYIIMEEYLNMKLECDWVNGLMPGIRIVKGVKNINHSKFTNDTLLLGGVLVTISKRFK